MFLPGFLLGSFLFFFPSEAISTLLLLLNVVFAVLLSKLSSKLAAVFIELIDFCTCVQQKNDNLATGFLDKWQASCYGCKEHSAPNLCNYRLQALQPDNYLKITEFWFTVLRVKSSHYPFSLLHEFCN